MQNNNFIVMFYYLFYCIKIYRWFVIHLYCMSFFLWNLNFLRATQVLNYCFWRRKIKFISVLFLTFIKIIFLFIVFVYWCISLNLFLSFFFLNLQEPNIEYFCFSNAIFMNYSQQIINFWIFRHIFKLQF